jgi:epoxyqueuosine reductase
MSAVLKAALWEQAAALGFQLLRVCGPDAALAQAANHLRWLERGHGADMHYLHREAELRYDARSLLPECRSVVVLALSYFHPGPLPEQPGKVAMYAWGDNYHNVIRGKLKTLGRWLDSQVEGHVWRPTIDSAPLAEKAFAVAAGVGWAGRNSLVLNHRLGSYFFIACLLTSVELPFDMAVEPACGTCTLCIQACPTDALLGPGILAAERCVSYLNTESQEKPDESTQLNGWLFGCDTCQRVCPFNAAAVPTAEPRFTPRPGILGITAQQAATMDEAEFNARFTGTTIRRRKYQRFVAAGQAVVAAESRSGAGYPGSPAVP